MKPIECLGYRYSVDHHDRDSWFDFPMDGNIWAGEGRVIRAYQHDWEAVAERCARDFMWEHDGWEASWPVSMKIWTGDGELVGEFEVDMEHVPEFSASCVS